MPSPPDAQPTLPIVDRGPEQGPRIDTGVRIDLGRLPAERARGLLVTLTATGNHDLAELIRHELEDHVPA